MHHALRPASPRHWPALAVHSLLLLALLDGTLTAQVRDIEQRCAAAGALATGCAIGADIVDITSARAVALSAGGNPVAGTASTFGRRVSAPRLAFTARATTGGFDLPDLDSPGQTDDGTAIGLNLDIAIGLTDGFSPAPTVGGVASIDLIGTIGTLRLPSAFDDGSPFTWAAGVRIGALRESFTAPGISLSLLYRRVGDLQVGDPGSANAQAVVMLDGVTSWSATAAIGKRLGLFGFTAGAGYTSFSTDATLRLPQSGGQVVEVADVAFDGSRLSVFGSASWTVTVWSLTAEVGWQNRGDALTEGGRTPASDARGGGTFVSLAARLTL
jgi:hypothetical protein